MHRISNIYLSNRFFYYLGGVAVLFIIAYAIPIMFWVGLGAFALFLVAAFLDLMMLAPGSALLDAKRKMNENMSLGDPNNVTLSVNNLSSQQLFIEVIDEVPVQYQLRNFSLSCALGKNESYEEKYTLYPTKRGEYKFGDIFTYRESFLHILKIRQIVEAKTTVKVYPSVLQMKQYELQMTSRTASQHGIKKLRRLGQNNEFEQIKNYVQGDDYRVINWKATSRRNELMVNQYQDERSQQVYCIIDKSRSMRMPFNGMSLLDYAINSCLTISNISMIKGDKAGLITFSDKLGARLKADRSSIQLRRIMDVLYKQKTKFAEANYQLLYYGIRQNIKGRSLVLLYTNFESIHAMERVLPLLRKINQMHLLVVVFFENTELAEAIEAPAESIREVYFKTLAEKYMVEKQQIASELRKYGIQSIISKPEELSVKSINKYLELKSRGLI